MPRVTYWLKACLPLGTRRRYATGPSYWQELVYHEGKRTSELATFAKPSLDAQDGRMLSPSALFRQRALVAHTPAEAMYTTSSGPAGDVDPNVWVDASAWGIGLVFDDQFAIWRWKHAQGGSGFQINLAELFAVEIAVLFLRMKGLRDTRVRIKTDSHAVRHAFTAGHSWPGLSAADACLVRIGILTDAHRLRLVFEAVGSKENLADPASRGKPPSCMSPLDVTFALSAALRRRLLRV